ncbi:hypothetical protein VKT23_005657 [Stygiomarasmius scandens]|uniref:SAP domain-containing protein n=1 Tax=Marasmiellus scandens TaxID=2682957 RepID=A0ABR1JPZ3_9AGAR
MCHVAVKARISRASPTSYTQASTSMPPLPDRQALENMKRADLQKLCKDYGVKANLKTENIINLLLDTYDSKSPHSHSEQPTRRSVSTRMSSRSSTAHGRTSSVIIHDIEEEESDNGDNTPEDDRVSEPIPEPSQSQSRTRKAKDTQIRLGVGRPAAVGGKGARAITKSLSMSRSKRGKNSRTVRPMEETIPEEPEPIPEVMDDSHLEPGSSDEGMESNLEAQSVSPTQNSSNVDKRISDALQPLYQQLKVFKSEFDQVQSLKNELSQLQLKLADAQTWREKLDSLTAEVKELRQKAERVDSLTAELEHLKQTVASLPHSTTPSDEDLAGFRTPTMLKAPGPPSLTVPSVQAGPSSLAPILLGKRHRDSTSSEMTGVVEKSREDEFTESELSSRVLRPDKKRARLALEINDVASENQAGPSTSLLPAAGETARAPSFTVFSGPEPVDGSYIDPPPPTTPLPNFYGPSSPVDGTAGSPRQGATTSTQHASENQHPFGFSFVPVPPTPGADLYSFPYPEPPQSPTPAGTASPTTFRTGRERTDVFQSFGLPAPERPRSRIQSSGARPRENIVAMEDTVDPIALSSEGPSAAQESDEVSNDISVRRTMYGTELDGDTRFGDFGVEGVANEFWTKGRF